MYVCMYVALGAPKKNGLREYEIIIESSFVWVILKNLLSIVESDV